MEEDLFILLNYEVVCRLCMQGRGALSDVFNTDEDPPLSLQIHALTDIDISINDGMPNKICHKCRYIVELSYEFRAMAVKNNKLLANYFETDVLASQVAESFKKSNANHEYYNEDSLPDDIQDNMEVIETSDMLDEDEIRILKKSNGKSDYKESLISVEPVVGTHMDLCSETGDLIVECKMESPEIFETSVDKHDYTSSKEVVLNQVKFEESDTSQVHLLPDMSDDDGLNLRHKDSGNLDRSHRQHTCQLCLEIFNDRTALLCHINEHYKNTTLTPYTSATKPFICLECNVNFTVKMDLIIHHREHFNINPYVCKVTGCNFDVGTREALRHHMYKHALKKYVCNLCGARYRRKVEILRHRVRHMDEGRQFRCGLCWVICKNRLSLKAHLKNHEIGRRFKCNFPGCPKAFYSNSDLVIHSRSHSNDKCFKCNLCICAYTSQSQLNRHLRRHEKPGPTKCDKCSEIFEDYGSFCNHRITTHGEWQPHRCKGCNQGYQSEQQLEKHMLRCQIALKMRELGSDSIDIIIEGKDDDSFMEDQNVEEDK